MKVLFLFGPNLGATGRREPEVYGRESLGRIMQDVERRAGELGHQASWRQSDDEGELVSALLDAGQQGVDAVVLNPGALAHYSYALRDAVQGCGLAVVEVHMSNVYAREEFRRGSVVAPACRAFIAGLGAGGYHLALEALPWITS